MIVKKLSTRPRMLKFDLRNLSNIASESDSLKASSIVSPYWSSASEKVVKF